MAQAEAASAGHEDGQQHPLGIYFKIWFWLFVLSGMSYMVDYMSIEGMLRWTLILIFMIAKASLIVAVFMHMVWERLALVYAVILPPIAVLVFTGLMVAEGDYTEITRILFFGESLFVPAAAH
jgi:cytochrome c oxidase subunit IV